MSTRIYQGFRINTTSLLTVKRMVDSFRPWVEKAAEDKMDAFFDMVHKNKNLDISAIEKIWVEMRQEIKKTGHRMPLVDTDFSLTLIPMKRFFLGVCYTEKTEWFDAWCNQPGVIEYGYWNNADHPEHIPYKKWEQRGKNWEIVSHDPMCMQGFSIDLVRPTGPLPKPWRNLFDGKENT